MLTPGGVVSLGLGLSPRPSQAAGTVKFDDFARLHMDASRNELYTYGTRTG